MIIIITNTVTETTMVLLTHSPCPAVKPVRLGGRSRGMLESCFSALCVVMSAGVVGTADPPPSLGPCRGWLILWSSEVRLTFVPAHIYTCTHIYLHTYIPAIICTSTHIYLHTYIPIDIYTCTNIYMCTRTLEKRACFIFIYQFCWLRP